MHAEFATLLVRSDQWSSNKVRQEIKVEHEVFSPVVLCCRDIFVRVHCRILCAPSTGRLR